MKNKAKVMLMVAMVICIMAGTVAFAPIKAAAVDATEMKVGDHVYFGINAAFDSKPILWRVVEIDEINNTATLLSKYLLESRAYEVAGGHNNWSGSDICAYLNDTSKNGFLGASFTLREQAAIVLPYSTTEEQGFDSDGKYTPNQKIVLPSFEEVNSWFESNSERAALHVNDWVSNWELDWWLRSPGPEVYMVTCIFFDGGVDGYDYGFARPELTLGVRPALKLDLSSVSFTSGAANSGNDKEKTYTVMLLAPKSAVTVMFKEEKLNLSLPIINVNGRTMYPFRECLEAIGADVSWVAETKTAKGTLGGQTVEFIVDSGLYKVNGKQMQMDAGVTSFIKDGRTYIPIRYAAEALGFTVTWDGETQTVNIK